MIKVVSAHDNIPHNAVVTGFFISSEQPSIGNVIPCKATPLTRIFTGYGKVRAETGEVPKKGFGKLISTAEIKEQQINKGLKLWLRLEIAA